MKYVTKIKRNKTLIESKQKNYSGIESKIKGRKLPKNIITIFIDAVSRARYIQKLKKSSKWFDQQAQNYKDTHQMFQAFRYMSVGINTSPNFYGKLSKNSRWNTTDGDENIELNSDGTPIFKAENLEKYKSITKTLSDAGYIIAKSRTICGTAITEHDPQDATVVQTQPIDHEFVSAICDPNYLPPNNPFGILQGPYSIFKKCLDGQEVNQYVFNYGKDFLQTYHDVPKYLEMYFLDGHEGTGDVINYFDDPLYNFLNWLVDNNHHKDYYIMMVSDHGLHMQGLYYLMRSKIYDIEVALPGLLILLDKNLIDEKERKALEENQQKVVTSFEIHYTLQFFTSEAQIDNSLFSSKILENNVETYQHNMINFALVSNRNDQNQFKSYQLSSSNIYVNLQINLNLAMQSQNILFQLILSRSFKNQFIENINQQSFQLQAKIMSCNNLFKLLNYKKIENDSKQLMHSYKDLNIQEKLQSENTAYRELKIMKFIIIKV
ncbi:unnamed protein product [Paramecium sonneborni]|uniref:Uncharacterized protein n=1 Tax=Paramecium sonneborni TaxID=65129 RepID=A0A8S1RJ08_9CILI|nr:unnamed protein product [Paramecium sonneborni]